MFEDNTVENDNMEKLPKPSFFDKKGYPCFTLEDLAAYLNMTPKQLTKAFERALKNYD